MISRSPTLAQRAALELMDEIRSGAIADADGLMPSEAALSLRLGVSRATLREALSHLEQRGLIVRRHGIGTFVHPNQPLMDFGLEELESIEAMARRTGVEIHMGECDIEERPASLIEAEALRIPEGLAVLAFRRVIQSGDRAIAFLSDVVPVDVLDPDEIGSPFEGSVLDVLLRRGGPALSHSLTEISAEAADAELARLLGIAAGDPLLRFAAHLSAADGRTVDYSLSYFIPGQFRFHIVRRVSELATGEPPMPAAAPLEMNAGQARASGAARAASTT